jgi:hypothetical protein
MSQTIVSPFGNTSRSKYFLLVSQGVFTLEILEKFHNDDSPMPSEIRLTTPLQSH